MKKAIIILLCVLISFLFSGCGDLLGGLFLTGAAIFNDDRAGKDNIFKFVSENEDTLIDCIDKGDFGAVNSNGIVREIDSDDIDKGFVDFDCGGSGLGSATSYCGFYYSADDDMTEVWCAPKDKPLSKSGSGYEWHEEKGDNTYYTENICGHFYYYEASF